MIRYSLKRGLAFIEDGRRWELTRRLPNTKLQLENEVGDLLSLADTEIHQRWMSSKWIVDVESLGPSSQATYFAAPRDLSTYTAKQREIARRRKAYIDAVEADRYAYDVEAWREAIAGKARELGDPSPPGASTVQGWWRKFRVTKDIEKLIPHAARRKGNRRGVRVQLFEEAVSKIFLSTQQLPKVAVYFEVCKQVEFLNAGRPEGERIQAPARSTVFRWLDQLQQDVVDTARLGAEFARAKYRVALTGLQVENVNERWEIDHTPVDLLVVDPETFVPIGRPWLTLIIDKASRMVVGFYLCIGSPSAYGVLQALRMAILPKEDLLSEFPDIQGVWAAHGLPTLIALDNGMDLHADALEVACLELGIQILYCGARTPEHKGSIERAFRTLASSLIHRIPGTVFSSVDQRGDYPAEELACIDMRTLRHLIVKWIVEIYSVTPHRGIGTTPLEKWYELAPKRQIELPASPKQLEVITGISARRTLFHYGIELEGLHYNSMRLQEIRRREGGKVEVDLKFYMDSVAYVHVFDPHVNEYIEVPSTAPEYTANLSRSVHRLVREHARKRFGAQCSIEQLIRAWTEIEEIIAKAMKSKKMAVRKGAAALVTRDSSGGAGSDGNSARGRPKTSSPSELPSGLDDEIPDLGSPREGGADHD